MTDEQKDLALELAYKEIVFLRSELQATDARLRREIENCMGKAQQLWSLRKAVDNARVLRETTDLKEFRVHLVETDWDRIVALAKDPT